MEIANVKEALNLNNKVKAITPHTLGMVLDKVGASGGGGGSSEMTCPYRVGDVLFSTIGDDPKDTYPGTTWVRIAEGKYIIGQTDSDSNFNTGGKTGGSWTHNHTMAHTHTLNGHTHTLAHTHTLNGHTHTLSHTHSIPKHNHALSGSGWAKIYFGGSSFMAKDKSTGNWSGNAKKTVSGTASSSTITGSYGVELGGATDDKAAYTSGDASTTTTTGSSVNTSAASNVTTTGSSANTSAASNETTSSPTIVLPYIVLYTWKRVS